MSETMSAPDRMQHAMLCYHAVMLQGVSPKEAYCAVCIAERLSIIEMDELWEKLKSEAMATADCEKVTAAEMLDAMKDHVAVETDNPEAGTAVNDNMIQQIIDKIKNPKKVKVKLAVSGGDNTSIKAIDGDKIDENWLSKVDEIDNPGGDTDEA